jgi:O-antigen/teichoic acid export membrane protein
MRSFMEETFPLSANESVRGTLSATKATAQVPGRMWPSAGLLPTLSKLMPLGYSLADQALAVGGLFLVNVVLARTQSKQEYGTFVLSYSVFTFLYGVYNAALLEPFTVYGSGRYRDRYSAYLRLMARGNVRLCVLATGGLLLIYLALLWSAPGIATRALAGLGLTIGVLLSSTFMRRAFYVQRQAGFAAATSLLFFITVLSGLWLAAKLQLLDSLSVFLILALGWIAGGAVLGGKLPFGDARQSFLEQEPGYWREHWNYTRWVLATAFVFQWTTQGYYWLVGAFLSVKDVGELRAVYLLVAPVEQVLVSLAVLFLPGLASHHARNGKGQVTSLWKHYAAYAVGITAGYALLVRIAGKFILHVLYAGKFDDRIGLLYVLVLLPLLMGIGFTMADALKASEKPQFAFYAYLCGGIVTLAGGIPLVIHWGLRGAVYGMFLSGATYTGVLALAFGLHLG